MRGGVALLAAALFAGGCGGEDVGPRYRAERDLYRAERERDKLGEGLRPGSRHRWTALAGRYENLARHHDAEVSPDAAASLVVRTIVATAWLRAAELHAVALDSVRSDQILHEAAGAFDGIASVAGDVALRRAEVAESRGELDEAIGHYRTAMDRIGLWPAEDDSTFTVLKVPLRVARLAARTSDDPADPEHYGHALEVYERLREHPTALVQISALGYLADIAADLGRWGQATDLLDGLERRLLEMQKPPRDPAEVRLASLTARQAHASPDSLLASLRSLLATYPKSPVAAQALLTVAQGAAARGQLQAAIGFLDWILRDYEASGLVPDVFLTRGLLLERSGRWAEALTEFRTLPIEYPTTPAALRAPLEIVAHYWRVGDGAAAQEALVHAELEYRELLVRYPAGLHTPLVRERLIQTLSLQSRHREALHEILVFADAVAGTDRELALLIEGARVAAIDLTDASAAVSLLDRAAERFPNTHIGAWAVNEAERLRGTDRP